MQHVVLIKCVGRWCERVRKCLHSVQTDRANSRPNAKQASIIAERMSMINWENCINLHILLGGFVFFSLGVLFQWISFSQSLVNFIGAVIYFLCIMCSLHSSLDAAQQKNVTCFHLGGFINSIFCIMLSICMCAHSLTRSPYYQSAEQWNERAAKKTQKIKYENSCK